MFIIVIRHSRSTMHNNVSQMLTNCYMLYISTAHSPYSRYRQVRRPSGVEVVAPTSQTTRVPGSIPGKDTFALLCFLPSWKGESVKAWVCAIRQTQVGEVLYDMWSVEPNGDIKHRQKRGGDGTIPCLLPLSAHSRTSWGLITRERARKQ